MPSLPLMPMDTREDRQSACEVKFLIHPELAPQIRDWARRRLEADPNAGSMQDQYRVASIYFDTPSFEVFHRAGSFGRSKYRIRRYGDADSVFLERKFKSKDLVTKRRSLVDVGDLDNFDALSTDRLWSGFWFHRRLVARGLAPVCRISYLRTARVGTSSTGPIRLTLDQDLRAVPISQPSFGYPNSDTSNRGATLSDGRLILELKYRYQMPVLFKQLTEEFGLIPQPVSKYRFAAAKLDLIKTATPAARPLRGSPRHA